LQARRQSAAAVHGVADLFDRDDFTPDSEPRRFSLLPVIALLITVAVVVDVLLVWR
jgi:hypothetical protein